jgi:hypothetical protein
MKIFQAISLGLFLALFVTSCGPSEKEIVRYNDEIVGHQHSVIIAEAELVNAISNNDTNIIHLALSDFIYQIENSLQLVGEIPEIDQEISLKNAAISMFNAYHSIALNQYPEIIDLNAISENEYTDEHEKRFQLLSIQIDDILNKKNQDFFETQQKLSEKYNIVFKIYTNGK